MHDWGLGFAWTDIKEHIDFFTRERIRSLNEQSKCLALNIKSCQFVDKVRHESFDFVETFVIARINAFCTPHGTNIPG